MTNNNTWIENTGPVPDGVTADTVIEVEYRAGFCGVDDGWDGVSFWEIYDMESDIIRWRFV